MRAAGLGFSEACDHAPRSRPDPSALLRSRIRAPPRVGGCLVSESADRPSRRLAFCVPASVPLGHKRAHSEWNAPFTARGVQVDWDSRPLRPQREGPRCLAKAASRRGNRDRPLTPCLSNPARTQGCRLWGVAPSLWARVERPSEYLVTHRSDRWACTAVVAVLTPALTRHTCLDERCVSFCADIHSYNVYLVVFFSFLGLHSEASEESV